eukprot:11201261-Lingulodinium_polyedra.AAC.1
MVQQVERRCRIHTSDAEIKGSSRCSDGDKKRWVSPGSWTVGSRVTRRQLRMAQFASGRLSV